MKPNGYGGFCPRSGEKTYAHRFAFVLAKGPIPAGLNVLHSCDNPRCVNPSHLFLGTTQDNIADKVRKNRQLRGETHRMVKLTDESVRMIRDRYEEGAQQDHLSAQFGVSRSNIGMIVRRVTWRHI